MAPIRIAIVGLSAKGAWAINAHLPYLRQSPHYEIVALLNSSVDAAKAAIKAHGLPSSVKAYGNPAELAADPDVDMVSISTNVATHYDLAKPILQKTKAKKFFIEWPLGSNVAQAKELTSLAKEKGITTVIGLQGRNNPTVNKLKELIESGRLGTVHSVNVQINSNTLVENAISEDIIYFADRKVGGNLHTIFTGHFLDIVLYVHGEIAKASYLSANLRPEINIKGPDGKPSNKTVRKDTPDQVMMQGRLKTGPVISWHLRAGHTAPGTSPVIWKVYGDKAEATFESETPFINMSPNVRITIADAVGGDVEVVAMPEDEAPFDGFPGPGKNVGRLYEKFAKGKEVVGWDHAVKNHELMDKFYEGEV